MKRVAHALSAVLSRDGSLTYPKLLMEMGTLTVKGFEEWRRGKVPFLERVVHMNLTKTSRVQTAVRGNSD
jgi:hypothetical protein